MGLPPSSTTFCSQLRFLSGCVPVTTQPQLSGECNTKCFIICIYNGLCLCTLGHLSCCLIKVHTESNPEQPHGYKHCINAYIGGAGGSRTRVLHTSPSQGLQQFLLGVCTMDYKVTHVVIISETMPSKSPAYATKTVHVAFQTTGCVETPTPITNIPLFGIFYILTKIWYFMVSIIIILIQFYNDVTNSSIRHLLGIRITINITWNTLSTTRHFLGPLWVTLPRKYPLHNSSCARSYMEMLTGIEPVTTTLPTRGGILSCVIYQSSTLLSYRHLKNWRKMKGSNLRVTEQQCLSRTSLLPIQAIFRITNLELRERIELPTCTLQECCSTS